MPETTPNSKGPAPAQYKPAATELALIPADQVKPEDIGTLSIEYRDGHPVIVVSGGKYAPSELPVVDSSGAAIAARFTWQTDASAPAATPQTRITTPPPPPQPIYVPVTRY
ncbi:hypothetical protein ACFYZH_23960 [Streptomyces abikoensis]|uniref:hypothetical protein n=1 Tax=Streptomyces abikoensis TaxID=97398 RepID=UPI0036A4082B